MNRTSASIAAAILILTLLGPTASAADRKPVTLEDAVSLAVAHSFGLDAARARIEESRARTGEVDAARRPAVRFAGGYTRLSEVPPFEISLPFLSSLPGMTASSFVVSPVYFNNYTLRLSLQQPVFTGFRLKKAAEAARLMEQAATQDERRDRAELEAGVRTAYWTAYRAAELSAVASDNRARVEAHLRDVANFQAQGLAVKADVLRVQAQLAAADLQIVEARTAAQSSQVVLASLTGLPLETEFEFLTTARDIDLGPGRGIESEAGLEALLARAKAARPELKSLAGRVQAAEAGIAAAQSGRYPQVFLAGNYYYLRPNPRLLPAQDMFYSTWDLGLTVSFDILNGSQTGYLARQAEAQRTQARDALSAFGDQVALEVTQAWLAVRQARERIAAADAAAVQAEESLRVAADRYKDGVALSADVLDAELLALQARTGRTQARVDLELARTRLRRAAGE